MSNITYCGPGNNYDYLENEKIIENIINPIVIEYNAKTYRHYSRHLGSSDRMGIELPYQVKPSDSLVQEVDVVAMLMDGLTKIADESQKFIKFENRFFRCNDDGLWKTDERQIIITENGTILEIKTNGGAHSDYFEIMDKGDYKGKLKHSSHHYDVHKGSSWHADLEWDSEKSSEIFSKIVRQINAHYKNNGVVTVK